MGCNTLAAELKKATRNHAQGKLLTFASSLNFDSISHDDSRSSRFLGGQTKVYMLSGKYPLKEVRESTLELSKLSRLELDGGARLCSAEAIQVVETLPDRDQTEVTMDDDSFVFA